MDAESLAAELGTDPRATAILLDALTSLELLTKQGDNDSVPADAAELLSEASPKNVLPMVRHMGNCLRCWAQLGRVTQSGLPAERIAGVLDEAAE